MLAISFINYFQIRKQIMGNPLPSQSWKGPSYKAQVYKPGKQFTSKQQKGYDPKPCLTNSTLKICSSPFLQGTGLSLPQAICIILLIQHSTVRPASPSSGNAKTAHSPGNAPFGLFDDRPTSSFGMSGMSTSSTTPTLPPKPKPR